MSETLIIQATYKSGVLRPSKRLDLTENQVVQLRLDTEIPTGHPHITQTPGICGGRPIVRGTRIPVKALVGYYRMGYTQMEILEGFPGLTAAQWHDALSFYYDHQADVDADMDADELPKILQDFNLKIDENGVLHLACSLGM